MVYNILPSYHRSKIAVKDCTYCNKEASFFKLFMTLIDLLERVSQFISTSQKKFNMIVKTIICGTTSNQKRMQFKQGVFKYLSKMIFKFL